MKLSLLACAAVAAFVAAAPARAADITGAGATFPFPVYSKWAEAYRKETGTGLNFQAIGSGGGGYGNTFSLVPDTLAPVAPPPPAPALPLP